MSDIEIKLDKALLSLNLKLDEMQKSNNDKFHHNDITLELLAKKLIEDRKDTLKEFFKYTDIHINTLSSLYESLQSKINFLYDFIKSKEDINSSNCKKIKEEIDEIRELISNINGQKTDGCI